MSESHQPELFASGPAAPVDLAPLPEEVGALAGALPPGVRMGTSSWGFPGWEGVVWDRQASATVLANHGLAAYARHPLLRCVGVDRSYYAPLDAATLARFAEQTPPDFRFVVKADRRLLFPGGPGSDPDLFLNPVWATQEVAGPVAEALGPRLGTLLFQFPPVAPEALGGPRRFAERLYRFLTALPTGLPRAVEIRTPALLNSDYAAALRHAGARHGYVVHPEMVSLEAQLERIPVEGASPVLVRWMLQPGQSYAGARDAWAPFRRLAAPDPERRRSVAALARKAAEAAGEVLVVVNNKAEGSSPLSVVELARVLVAD